MDSTQGRIRVLDAAVAEKIAAGEVIESPASVVKELLENAIDAGASRIDIAIEDAGFSLIRVADNGPGMSADDLNLCILRHATSKISSLEDIYALQTLGFRGEALASITAVSRFELMAADNDEGLAHRVKGEGGVIGERSPVPRTRGTTVSVRDLFFNTPARKKFMKSRSGERSSIIRIIEQLVIPYPAIHFTLSAEGKKVIDAPQAADILERIAQVAGTEFAQGLVRCQGEFETMDIDLYITRPEQARPRPRHQNLYVNLRRIDNDTIGHAIRSGFSSFIMSEFKPAFFCLLSIDAHCIDVNIHPTKQKAKFDDEQRLFGLFKRFVERQLQSALNPMDELHDSAAEPLDWSQPQSWPSSPPLDEPPALANSFFQEHAGESVVPPTESQTVLHFPSARAELPPQKSDGQDSGGGVQLAVSAGEEQWSLIQCFQLHNIFILAPIKNGMLLIDQHAAHERVLFEQAMRNLQYSACESQQLLFPITIELSPTEKAIVDSGTRYFRSFGFELNDFGGSTVSVSAIPAFLKDSRVKEAIHEMLDYLVDGQALKEFPETHKRFAAGFACGSAIRAGQTLSAEEMNHLLNQLFATENPYICPHGRPTLIRLSLGELRRRFLR